MALVLVLGPLAFWGPNVRSAEPALREFRYYQEGFEEKKPETVIVLATNAEYAVNHQGVQKSGHTPTA